jgi:hypothetical protein
LKLEDLKKLCSEATAGPWEWLADETMDEDPRSYFLSGPHREAEGLDDWIGHPRDSLILDDGSAYGEYTRKITPDSPDARFIAAARTYLPLLIAVAEAANKLVAQLREDEVHYGYFPIGAVRVYEDALKALEATP